MKRTKAVPRPIDMNRIASQQSPQLRRIRFWYHRINAKLGHPLPRVAFIGWLPRHMEKRFLGFSCWLDFGKHGKGIVIMLHRRIAFAPNLWMASLTHEIDHLLNPGEECGTENFENSLIALRRKILNIRKWRML